MLRNGDQPYWEKDQFPLVFSDNPDIITIMLGTNDSKPYNWDTRKSEFSGDCHTLIDTLLTISSSPAIYLCLPPPAFPPETHSISAANIAGGIVPILQQVAHERNIPLIDVHTPLLDSVEYFPDHVHPNNDGKKAIARILRDGLTGGTGSMRMTTSGGVRRFEKNGRNTSRNSRLMQINGRLTQGHGNDIFHTLHPLQYVLDGAGNLVIPRKTTKLL